MSIDQVREMRKRKNILYFLKKNNNVLIYFRHRVAERVAELFSYACPDPEPSTACTSTRGTGSATGTVVVNILCEGTLYIHNTFSYLTFIIHFHKIHFHLQF